MTEPGFRVAVVTLFPELVASVVQYGVVGRAAAGALTLDTINPRTFASDRHRSVDDAPFGGGPGMVLQVEPLRRAIAAARAQCPGAPVVALCAQGDPVDQQTVGRLAAGPGLVLVCGRYEGIDERVLRGVVDEELSVGDFVVTGGELPAMLVIDAVVRLLPGALGNVESAHSESFSEGLLEGPQYTRPAEHDVGEVPPVLLSGDHAAIRRWRRREALGRTWVRRPELLDERKLSDEDRVLLGEFVAAFLAARGIAGGRAD